MKFQWTSEKRIDEELYRFCIDLEYKLRQRITRFLIERNGVELPVTFDDFCFEVDLTLEQVVIAPEVSHLLSRKFCRDFDREINLDFTKSLFAQRPFSTAG